MCRIYVLPTRTAKLLRGMVSVVKLFRRPRNSDVSFSLIVINASHIFQFYVCPGLREFWILRIRSITTNSLFHERNIQCEFSTETNKISQTAEQC